MERSARPSAGADGRHPLTNARPMRQSAIQQGRRARAGRTCRAIFRIDTVFILQHRDNPLPLDPERPLGCWALGLKRPRSSLGLLVKCGSELGCLARGRLGCYARRAGRR
jgi:hypothetical protein